MNRFTILKGSQTITIDIDDMKFFIGNNENIKYLIFSSFRSLFNKIKNSEYAITNMIRHDVLYNNGPIDPKEWRYVEISPFFDLETDMKLGTKSLLNKYLEAMFFSISGNDDFQTMNMLARSINDDYLQTEENAIDLDGDKILNFNLFEIPTSIIQKEIVPTISGDDYYCNYSDLTYEEIIILQLKVLIKTASLVKDKIFIGCAHIPLITPKIKKILLNTRYPNLNLFVFTSETIGLNRNYYSICSESYIDLANDDMIMDRIMDLPFHIEKDSLILELNNHILGHNNDLSNKIWIELFQ